MDEQTAGLKRKTGDKIGEAQFSPNHPITKKPKENTPTKKLNMPDADELRKEIRNNHNELKEQNREQKEQNLHLAQIIKDLVSSQKKII